MQGEEKNIKEVYCSLKRAKQYKTSTCNFQSDTTPLRLSAEVIEVEVVATRAVIEAGLIIFLCSYTGSAVFVSSFIRLRYEAPKFKSKKQVALLRNLLNV